MKALQRSVKSHKHAQLITTITVVSCLLLAHIIGGATALILNIAACIVWIWIE